MRHREPWAGWDIYIYIYLHTRISPSNAITAPYHHPRRSHPEAITIPGRSQSQGDHNPNALPTPGSPYTTAHLRCPLAFTTIPTAPMLSPTLGYHTNVLHHGTNETHKRSSRFGAAPRWQAPESARGSTGRRGSTTALTAARKRTRTRSGHTGGRGIHAPSPPSDAVRAHASP